MGNTGGWRHVFSSLVILAILLTAIPAVSAYAVSTVTDPTILLHSGDTISVRISNLNVGENLKYRLTSSDLDTIGDTVISNSVILPFGFKPYPVTHLSTTGYSLAANPLTVDYNNGDVHFNPTYPANTNPIEITNANVHAGDYILTLKGTKIPGAATTIDYSVGGIIDTVSNTDPQILTFTIKNANSGHLTIEVFDGAVSKFSERYTIGTITPSPTQGSESNDDGPSAPKGPSPQLAPPGLLAPICFSPSYLTLQHNDTGNVLADYTVNTDPAAGYNVTMGIKNGTKIVTGAGKPVDEIIITPLCPDAIPMANGSVYSSLGIAIECEPTGTLFSPQGAMTLSFTPSPQLWATTLAKVDGNSSAITIGFYDAASETWITVPTTVDPITRTISAPITHFSIFSLISKSKTDVSTRSGSLVSPIPTKPIAAGTLTQMAPPSTQSPGLPGVAVIGTILFVGYCVMRKKQ
ncbi:MAG: hypothetical protein Q7T80_09185 [Methanoregula sp.]|nr:hypothetical protein [Methanoregula sp.]